MLCCVIAQPCMASNVSRLSKRLFFVVVVASCVLGAASLFKHGNTPFHFIAPSTAFEIATGFTNH